MRRKFSLVLTLAAWLLATGAQWDLAQTFAWGRMLATYSETMPFLAAVKKTFSGEELCNICAVVQDVRRDEPGNPAAPTSRLSGKILLVCSPSEHVFAEFIPLCAGLLPDVSVPSSAERSAPPSPPPRAVA